MFDISFFQIVLCQTGDSGGRRKLRNKTNLKNRRSSGHFFFALVRFLENGFDRCFFYQTLALVVSNFDRQFP